MFNSELIVQSHALAWASFVRHEFETIVGWFREIAKVPVGKGGKLDGVDESDTASGG